MKYNVISLERAFLRREFRSVRLILSGRSAVEPPKKIIVPALPVLPVILPPKPELIVKEPIVSIEKHIDTLKTIDELPQKPVQKIEAPKSWATRSEVVFEAPKKLELPKLPKLPVLPKLPSVPKLPAVPKLPTQPKLPARPKTSFHMSPKWRTALFGSVIAACLLILTIVLGPSAYYSLFPSDPVPIKSSDAGSALGGSYASGSSRVVSKIPDPVYDANLPDGTWLIIPKIGVKTEILESAEPDESLNKGVWRVPDFGTPTDLSKPMILAAHRYGWKAWWENGNQYWRYHSFYLLPDLEKGDLIQVISDHRKYFYEVYGGEQGEDITDYNADLILYTCKFLDSPLRFFRYARLVDPNNPTSLSSK